MDLLTKLEHALEGMFEGVFSRAFKTPLQPVEVAKRLTRELENHRTISVNATYVPNIYTVHLSTDTYQEFQPISGRLQRELAQYLREFIAEHHYQTVGAIIVALAEDDQLRGHEMNVTVANLEDAPATSAAVPEQPPISTDATQRTAPFTAPTQESSVREATGLEVTAGEMQGRHIALCEGLTIGRGPTNVVALSEPDISRRHAEITRQNGAWEIHDLGSTNGTFVNDRRITSHALLPGDVIQIGHTAMLAR